MLNLLLPDSDTYDIQERFENLVLWALAWAVAIIASAVVFKRNPFGDWIEVALYVGAAIFWFWQSQRLVRYRCY